MSNEVSSSDNDVKVEALGSGSDYTPFIQHIGVPSSDIGSSGRYGRGRGGGGRGGGRGSGSFALLYMPFWTITDRHARLLRLERCTDPKQPLVEDKVMGDIDTTEGFIDGFGVWR